MASQEVFLSWCGVFYSVWIPLPLWWLVLLIEALVLFPKCEREGRQQLAILKGNI